MHASPQSAKSRKEHESRNGPQPSIHTGVQNKTNRKQLHAGACHSQLRAIPAIIAPTTSSMRRRLKPSSAWVRCAFARCPASPRGVLLGEQQSPNAQIVGRTQGSAWRRTGHVSRCSWRRWGRQSHDQRLPSLLLLLVVPSLVGRTVTHRWTSTDRPVPRKLLLLLLNLVEHVLSLQRCAGLERRLQGPNAVLQPRKLCLGASHSSAGRFCTCGSKVRFGDSSDGCFA